MIIHDGNDLLYSHLASERVILLDDAIIPIAIQFLSICRSVCHAGDPRLNGSRYEIHFASYDRVIDNCSFLTPNFVVLILKVRPERVR